MALSRRLIDPVFAIRGTVAVLFPRAVPGRAWLFDDGAVRLPAPVVDVRDGRLDLLQTIHED